MWHFCWYQYRCSLVQTYPYFVCVCVWRSQYLIHWAFYDAVIAAMSGALEALSVRPFGLQLCNGHTRAPDANPPLHHPHHTHPWHSSPFLCSFVCANNSRTTLHVKWTFDLTCPKPNFVLIQQNHSMWNWKEFPEWVAALPVVVGNAIQCWYTG